MHRRVHGLGPYVLAMGKQNVIAALERVLRAKLSINHQAPQYLKQFEEIGVSKALTYFSLIYIVVKTVLSEECMVELSQHSPKLTRTMKQHTLMKLQPIIPV